MKSLPFQVGWFPSFPAEGGKQKGKVGVFLQQLLGRSVVLGDLGIQNGSVKRSRQKKPKLSCTEKLQEVVTPYLWLYLALTPPTPILPSATDIPLVVNLMSTPGFPSTFKSM